MSYSNYYPIFNDTNVLNSKSLQILYNGLIVVKYDELIALDLPVLDQTAMKLLIHLIINRINGNSLSTPETWYGLICNYLHDSGAVKDLLTKAVSVGIIHSYLRSNLK